MSEFIEYKGTEVSALTIGKDGSVEAIPRVKLDMSPVVNELCAKAAYEAAEAMRAACIAAIEALPHWVESNDRINYIAIDSDAVLAALREVQP